MFFKSLLSHLHAKVTKIVETLTHHRHFDKDWCDDDKYDKHDCHDDKDDDDKDTQEPTYEKVFFGEAFDDNGNPVSGYFIEDEAPNPNPYNVPSLPEGTEPTFGNYLAHFEDIGGDVTKTEAIVFYETAEDGSQQEAFRIDAPEGGFEDADDVLAAYDEALEDNDATNLMVSLSVETDPEDDIVGFEDDEDEPEEAWAA